MSARAETLLRKNFNAKRENSLGGSLDDGKIRNR